MKAKGLSTRAERFASPRSCATKWNPKRSANASISGTGIISRPVPRSTTTCVLSIITRSTTPPHVAQRVAEKHLAVESLEPGVDLEEQQARVGQHRRSGLRLVVLAAHFDRVRRRIVLHLYPRFELIVARRYDRSLSDTLPAAECGQCRLRQRFAAGSKFFMDSYQIPLAGDPKLEDLVPIAFGVLSPVGYPDLGRVGT